MIVTHLGRMRLNAPVDDPDRAPSPARRWVDAIADCVPVIGADEFTERFLHTVEVIGAGQVTAFAYESAGVRCLLSRNFLSEDKGGALAAAYLDGWYREDPLFQRAKAMEENSCAVERLEDLLPDISSQYLATFFCAPGFRTKVAVLVAQGPLRLALNLYFAGDATDRAAQTLDGVGVGLYRLLGKALAAHFLLTAPEFPLPLAVLSERERQVCIGMLAGKKAEIIAQEIGVGPSSVVTYRQRAYQKLGISSRGQLFSICRSWSP